MNKFIKQSMAMASLLALSHKSIAQNNNDYSPTVHLTIGAVNFIQPADFTRKPVTVGIEVQKPLNSIVPLTAFAGVEVPVLGQAGSERKNLTYALRNENGTVKAQGQFGLNCDIAIIDGDQEFGLRPSVKQVGFVSEAGIFGTQQIEAGIYYKSALFQVNAGLGQQLGHGAAFVNNYIANPDFVAGRDDMTNYWKLEPSAPPAYFFVKAAVNLSKIFGRAYD